MKIGNVDLSSNVFIVAEIGANHGNNLDIALKSIEAAKEAGANAVKFQTFTPDSMTLNINSSIFMANPKGPWAGMKLYDLYKKSYMPWDWYYKLKEYAEKLGMVFFSTPFDFGSVDFLEELGVPIYKIASYEITDIPLIEYVASKGKPIFISTGIATLSDIYEAVEICKNKGNKDIVLLKCTSSYPTPIEEANLLTLKNMKEVFGCIVGLSDHTLGISAPIVATALGARVIEKHFILSKSIDSPDREFSLTPDEFASMVKNVRDAEKAIGKITYELTERMKSSRRSARSLFAVKDIKKGERFSKDNIKSLRPNFGLHPKYFEMILGKRASCDIKKGTPIKLEHVSFY